MPRCSAGHGHPIAQVFSKLEPQGVTDWNEGSPILMHRSNLPFGSLLRALRTERGLTQEELAAAANLSVRAVSDLERGVNHAPRRDTARLLAEALRLNDDARAAFDAAARRGRVPGPRTVALASAAGMPAATLTLPRDITSFTGRDAELRFLLDTSAQIGTRAAVGLYSVSGMAGVGKTVLAVHAAHQLAPRFPDGQIFLQLHGHTRGQHPCGPSDALASLLLTAGVSAERIPNGLDARSRLWRHYLAGRHMLLVLDDAAGHDQIRPLLPGTAGCLVLVTSRQRLTALEDARSIDLGVLAPHEAAALMIRLADRRDLEPGDPSIAQTTALCGQLPLAIGMLARQLHHHPTWTCAKLAAELAAAQDRLAFMRAENLSVTAAFDLSYDDLADGQRRLFRCLGLHPGAEIDAYAAAALDGSDLSAAMHGLDALYQQHLLTEPVAGRYLLHNLIREHARARAREDPDLGDAMGRLLDYYLRAARMASDHLDRPSPGNIPAVTVLRPRPVPPLPTRADAIAWMEAERANLHAIVGYAGRHGHYGHALAIPAALHGFLRRFGYWDQALHLHHIAVDAARRLGDQFAEAIALTDLGGILQLTNDYLAATTVLSRALNLYRAMGDELGEASALNELGVVQERTGEYKAAELSHQRALHLYRQLRNKIGEAGALDRLGVVQRTTGDHAAAVLSHKNALRLCRETGYRQGEAGAFNRLGAAHYARGDYQAAIASHEQALHLYREIGYRLGEAGALNWLGTAQYAVSLYQEAMTNVEHALRLYRELGHRIGEAHALNTLGAVQLAAGDHQAAAASHRKALRLYRQVGHGVGEARAHAALARVHTTLGETMAAARSMAGARELYRQLGIAPTPDQALPRADTGRREEISGVILEIPNALLPR